MNPQPKPVGSSRRHIMSAGALLLAAAPAATAMPRSPSAHGDNAAHGSGFATAKGGAQIFYKDWGTGQPIVFSHRWPLNADKWDAQMMFFGERGFRVAPIPSDEERFQ